VPTRKEYMAALHVLREVRTQLLEATFEVNKRSIDESSRNSVLVEVSVVLSNAGKYLARNRKVGCPSIPLLAVRAELFRCTACGSPNTPNGLDDLVVSEILERAHTNPCELVDFGPESPLELVEVVEAATVATNVTGVETQLMALLFASNSFLKFVEYLSQCVSNRKRSQE
jgi:hypothetical protein